MSHCCGGCGGEDPSKKKTNVVSEVEEQKSSEKKMNEAKSKNDTKVGTWQPEKITFLKCPISTERY